MVPPPTHPSLHIPILLGLCVLPTHPLLLSIRGERWCKADPTSTAASRRRRSRRLRSTEVCWNPSATMVPALTEETAHCCAAVKNGDVSTVDDPIGWYQPITGTEDDYGLCGVVEVSLPSNRLVGKLDDSNVAAIQAASQEATSTGGSRGRLGLTALQLLDVSTPVDPENQEEIDNANKLTGAIPTWLLELPTLRAPLKPPLHCEQFASTGRNHRSQERDNRGITEFFQLWLYRLIE